MKTTYIIGGVPRAGKTQLSRILFTEFNVPYITTDWLREGFQLGAPDFGIFEGQSDADKAIVLWPYFKGLITARKYYQDPLVIEGTNFLPQYLNEVKELPYVRICFLGYTEVDVADKAHNIKILSDPRGDWTDDYSDEKLLALVDFNIKVSDDYKKACVEYDLAYFDTGKDFNAALREAANYLVNG